ESPQPSSDDLFGAPESPQPSADDLFGPASNDEGASQDDNASGEGASSDLFDVGTGADDLFGPPPTDASDSSSSLFDPAEIKQIPASTESDPTSDFDALFGDPPADAAEKDASAAIEKALQLRTWHDNTGLFQVDARLVEVYPDKVRLLKANGRTCTVPLRRLSPADLGVVQQIAAIRPDAGVKFISIEK
ncbi:MAG: hypothetical protein D6753_02945, partial [Planctomycetota bacterium]